MGKRKFAGANIELLTLEALKFNNRTEFFKKSRSAYKECLRLDVMDRVCAHMNKHNALNGTHGNCTMSNEDIFLLAKPFTQISHFKEAFPGAYEAARRRGIKEEVCEHMQTVGNRFYRKIYVFEHSDNSAYIGLSYNPEKRRKAHLNINKTLIKKSKQTTQTFKILTDWIPAKEASEQERLFVREYIKSGWLILNKAPAGGLGGDTLKWTKQECIKIANSCLTRVDFFKKSPSAYQSARVNGWSEEICSHMVANRTLPWTKKELTDIALSCNTRYEFKRKSTGAYKAARNNGILDEICAHMPKDCRSMVYKDRPNHKGLSTEIKTIKLKK